MSSKIIRFLVIPLLWGITMTVIITTIPQPTVQDHSIKKHSPKKEKLLSRMHAKPDF